LCVNRFAAAGQVSTKMYIAQQFIIFISAFEYLNDD